MEISAAFATSLDTPAHVALAEDLGYKRAWLYDSPALYPDVWAMLSLAAERTSRIHIGPAVLIPSLRHPMANAAAIATLAYLAPGRLEVAIGSGFTGRMTLGQRPLPWKFVRQYVMAVQALLRGEKVEWEGRLIQMMHPEGFAPQRPIEVPILLGVGGPKGVDVASELAEGVFVAGGPRGFDVPAGARCAVLTFGTVLDDTEDPGSERALAAAGHAASVNLHGAYERGADLSRIPHADRWLAELDLIPEIERHIALHDLHLIGLNERDARVVTGALLRQFGHARTAAEWRERITDLAGHGATEIAYQPAGPDIPGELRRFAQVAGL